MVAPLQLARDVHAAAQEAADAEDLKDAKSRAEAQEILAGMQKAIDAAEEANRAAEVRRGVGTWHECSRWRRRWVAGRCVWRGSTDGAACARCPQKYGGAGEAAAKYKESNGDHNV